MVYVGICACVLQTFRVRVSCPWVSEKPVDTALHPDLRMQVPTQLHVSAYSHSLSTHNSLSQLSVVIRVAAFCSIGKMQITYLTLAYQ